MDAYSSDEEGGGGESMDFCIADTQVDATSAHGRASNGPREIGRDFNFSCTQVDDGLPSDRDEEEDRLGDNHGYGGTQVDEDFFERMMLEYNESPLGKAGAATSVAAVSAREGGRRRSVNFADEACNGSDSDVEQQMDVDAEPAELLGSAGVAGSAEQPREELAVLTTNGANSGAHIEQPNQDLSQEHPQEQDEEEGEEDEDMTQGGDSVDFCIADTQAPLPFPPSPVRPPAPSTADTSAAAPTSTAVPGASGRSALSPVAILEDTHLTVYDYLSLSAPVSAGEAAKGTTTAHISSTPIFSAIDATPAEANTVGSTAYGTARTGPRTGSTARTPLPGAGPFKMTGDTPEEEPTQLDGSSVHEGSGESPVRERLQESETHASVPFSAEKVRSASLQASLSPPGVAPAPHAPVPINAPTTTAAGAAAAALNRSATSSEFGMDWISAKAPKAATSAAYVAYQDPAPRPAPIPTPATATVHQSASPRAAVLPVPLAVSATAVAGEPQLLEDRSLEDLLQMQERLQRLIQSKVAAAQQSGTVTAAAPLSASIGAADAAEIAAGESSLGTRSSPPLQRQDTSYGMSQPTNLAISGLIRLRNDPTPGALDTAVSSSSTSPRNAGVPGAATAAAAAAGAFSPASPATTSAALTTAPTSATSAGADVTPSPTKKFFRRKFAGGKSPAAQGVSDKDAFAAHMFAPDDIVDDASLEGENGRRDAKSAQAKVSPAKVTFNLQPAARPEKAAASKRPPAGIGRASASRVIQDTDDVDDGFGADDGEAEFDDAHTSASTGAQASSRSGGKNATPGGLSDASRHDNDASNAEAGAADDTAARAQLPADVPPSLLYHLPTRFADLWPTLTALGWHWKRGGGIVSYYYIRPNCSVKKGFFLGKDYFGDEAEVLQFVSAVVMSCRKLLPVPKLPVPPPAPVAVVASSPEVPSKSTEPPRASAAPTKSAPARSGGKGEAAAPASTASQGKASAAPASNVPVAASTACKPSQHPRALSSLPSTHSVLQLPDDPLMHDINKIPWKWLWKILRDKDWTWDFGPQHCNYYFAPGYDLKSKDAVMGEHKFDSEDSVRRFVRKQNWPEFCGGALERQSSIAAESQPLDAYLHDPSWKLASHRRKRGSAASSRGDNRSGSDSESSDEDKRGRSDGGASKKVKTDGRPSLGTTKTGKSAAPGPAKAAAAAGASSSEPGRHSQASHAAKPPLPPPAPVVTSAAACLSRHDSDYGLATQPQNASQVSPIAVKKRSAASSRSQASQEETASAAAAATSAEVQLFAGKRYVVSGMQEKLKEQLVREITRRGGTILNAVPVDGDAGQDELVLVGKTGQRVRKGCVVVVSHPKEFRKPNYLLALATGVALVHHQWVRDSLDRGALQPFAAYQLPSGCTALHGYTIFAAPRVGASADSGGLGPALSPGQAEGILTNVKVLNFAGSGWDNLLLAAGAAMVQNSASLVQTLQQLASTPSGAQSSHRPGGAFGGRGIARLPVDVILVDPLEYATAVTAAGRGFLSGGGDSLLTAGGARYTTPSAASHSSALSPHSGAKSPAAKMSDAELAAVHACARLQASSRQGSSGSARAIPAAVTTDWLVHCLAVGYVLDHHLLDVFTPPEEPDRKPYTYKADSVTGTGERYTKHDIVSYSIRSGPAKPLSAERGARTQETVAMGQILGFTRRDAKSPLFARIRPLVPKSSVVAALPVVQSKRDGGAGDHATEHMLHKELIGCPSTAVAMVEVERLCGKVVLLRRQDFERVHYGAQDSAVFYASPEWIAENPCPLVGENDGEDSQGMGEGMRIQRSQDY